MRCIIVLFIIILVCNYFQYVEMMTEAQMQSTGKLLRNVCQPKTKVTDAQIDNMHKGIFEDDKKPKCYMYCVLQMMNVMKKNGKPDYEYVTSHITQLAPKYQEPMKIIIEKCKDEGQEPDPCEASYSLVKCMYFSNPEMYFLP